MTAPWWASDDGDVTLHLGDCLAVLPGLPDSSVDAVVTDPPYGLEFMGREWDGADGFRRSLNGADAGRDSVFGRTSRTSPEYIAGHLFQRWCEQWAAECLRVLKPGGHLLAFGGTRTWHRLVCGIEDAGFEVRDAVADLTGYDAPGLMWVYGSGFPKSLDVSKAIDRRRDDYPAIRQVVEFLRNALHSSPITRRELEAAFGGGAVAAHFLAPSRSNAGGPTWEQWQQLRALIGFGDEMDAEVWRLNGRKGTPGEAWEQREVTQPGVGQHTPGDVISWDQRSSKDRERRDIAATEDAARWEGWGTALKPGWEPIAVGRKPLAGTVASNVVEWGTGALNIDGCRVAHASDADRAESEGKNRHADFGSGARENNIFGDMSQHTRADEGNYDGAAGRWPPNVVLSPAAAAELDRQSGDCRSGGISSRQDFPTGMFGGVGTRQGPMYKDTGGASRFFPVFRYEAKAAASERPRLPDGTAHPTVKPVDLMAWLIRLVTPPGGTVLDPFAGSGTTAQACIVEGFRAILIEQDPQSAELIKTRLSKPIQPSLFGGAA